MEYSLTIIDDQPLIIEGIKSVFQGKSDYNIIGTAQTLAEGKRLIQKKQPDLVIIDPQIGDEAGKLLELAKKHGAKVLILTRSRKNEDFLDIKAKGINGFILKYAKPEELYYAVYMISQGKMYYDPEVMENLLEREDRASLKTPVYHLTPKELDVLKSLGEGLTNKEIAGRFKITEYTVKKHVSRVLTKLNFADRTKAALFANYTGIANFSMKNKNRQTKPSA